VRETILEPSSANAGDQPSERRGPISVSSGNGVPAVAQAMAAMLQGADTLEAVVSGVVIVENDPNDTCRLRGTAEL